MPRDGSGNYTLPVGNPVVTDTIIASDWANDTMEDVALQLNNVLTRDGVLGPLGAFKLVDGAVGTPGLAFNSEPGLGLYRVNTSIMSFTAAAKQTFVFDASTAAAVVHSAYPRSAGSSEIRLNTDIYGEANTTALQIGQNATNGYIKSLAVGSDPALPILYSATSHDFTGRTRVVATAGNDSQLELDRITTTTDTASLNWTTNGVRRFEAVLGANDETGNAGNLAFYRFENNGSTSENALNISRADGVVSMQRQLQVGTAQTAGQTSLIVTRQSQFGEQIGVTASGTAINCSAGAVSASTGFSFNSANNWGLTANTARVSGSNSAADFLNGAIIGTTATMQASHTPAVASTFIFAIGGGGQSFVMNGSGTGSSLGGWVATSDMRLKKNAAKIENALSKVSTLNGYTFDRPDMIGEDGVLPRKAGYYAQEIQAVLPEAVLTDRDEMGTLSVDHNGVIGLLIEAVKELDARTQIH